eukprot:TRINITY_DN3560_c0_g1_i1.p1 TRINITY_DN3560_c0_g1~~TRINITY_DN3560_c0_g1_i1.p1  ORF type:complete len:664 (-),score=111.14 TRINITY_DN3560_c0_g1_i1:421-2412(-)
MEEDRTSNIIFFSSISQKDEHDVIAQLRQMINQPQETHRKDFIQQQENEDHHVHEMDSVFSRVIPEGEETKSLSKKKKRLSRKRTKSIKKIEYELKTPKEILDFRRTMSDKYLFNQYVEVGSIEIRDLLTFYHDLLKFIKKGSGGKHLIKKIIKKYHLADGEPIIKIDMPHYRKILETIRINYKKKAYSSDFFDELFEFIESIAYEKHQNSIKSAKSVKIHDLTYSFKGDAIPTSPRGDHAPLLPVILHKKVISDSSIDDKIFASVQADEESFQLTTSRIAREKSDKMQEYFYQHNLSYITSNFTRGMMMNVNIRITKDSYENIDDINNTLFLMEEEINDSNLLFSDKSADPETLSHLIGGITIFKLINYLTSSYIYDRILIREFLYVFPLFLSLEFLFELLYTRWNMPCPKDINPEDFEAQKLRPVRNSIYQLVKTLLEDFKYYTKEIRTKNLVERFLYKVVATDNFFLEKVEDLRRINSARKNGSRRSERNRSSVSHSTSVGSFSKYSRRSSISEKRTPLKSSSPSNNIKLDKDWSLLPLHPDLIVEQLCLMDQEYYRKISPIELLDTKWSKGNKEIESPNVMKYIRYFNNTSAWVSSQILKESNIKSRATVLNRFIYIADKCRSLKNFNSVMVVLSSLQSASIFRLKYTWQVTFYWLITI